MNRFRLYQCIDCKQESKAWTHGPKGRSYIRTWHFRAHKKHSDRDGYTFFTDERFWPNILKKLRLKK